MTPAQAVAQANIISQGITVGRYLDLYVCVKDLCDMITAVAGSSGTYLDTSLTSQTKAGLLTASGVIIGFGFSNGTQSGRGIASQSGQSLALGANGNPNTGIVIDTSGALFATAGVVPGSLGTGGMATLYGGTGAPSFYGPNGSLYLRYDGSGSTLLYQNTSGASSSGYTWVPFVGGVMAGGTGTITSVAASATSVTLLAANSNRLGVIITNDSSANLYVAFAASATTSAYSVKLAPGAVYETDAAVYTGIITGIWDSATGNARITEVTA